MRLGLLISGSIARWQLQALERACAGHQLFLLTCPPSPSSRSPRHAGYYLLNSVTIRNRLTKAVPFPEDRFHIGGRFNFTPTFEGAWAVLPDDVLDWVNEQRLDAIIKFGLGLLRVPPAERLPVPILSFHHGDPRAYRGRPAGFYELLNGEHFIGQVVQALGPKLDGGVVYAFAQSSVAPHSYKKTLLEAYSLSTFLLGKALENLRLQRPVAIAPTGRNYRLPSNWQVARFVGGRAAALVRRIGYGAFVEKKWKVATAEVPETNGPAAAIRAAADAAWATLPVPPPFTFYADPFYGADEGEIFVEALNSRTGKGEIVRVGDGEHQRISGFGGHVSYPAGIEENGKWVLVPETADWSGPGAFVIRGPTAEPIGGLDIDEAAVLDPTLVRHDGRVYLFGNLKSDGPAILHLWHADGLRSRFARHPASPIRVSARGSRMAGEIREWQGQLYRLGQDRRRSYGDGVLAFRITELSPDAYAEDEGEEAAFTSVAGPHTVNRRGQQLLFDYYTEEFSLLAGARRLLARL